MKAMLLAAGYGRRMFPYTLDRPKPIIPVLGRPLIVQSLRWLGGQGVDEAVVNLHYMPEAVEALVGDGGHSGTPAVHYSYEEAILGTAGALRHAAARLVGGGSFAVCNADFLSDIDLRAVTEQHLVSGHAATLVLMPWRPGYAKVQVDAAGRVISLRGLPEVKPGASAGDYLFTGCHVLDDDLIDRIPPEGPSDIVADVYQELAGTGRLGAFVHQGFWWEFGTPATYLDGSLALLGLPPERLRDISPEHDPTRQLGEAAAAVGPGSDIDATSQFYGKVALGYSCRVCEEARIEDCVIMPEAWVGPGCRLRRTVVDHGVELPAGFAADNAIVCVDRSADTTSPGVTRKDHGLLVLPLDGDAD